MVIGRPTQGRQRFGSPPREEIDRYEAQGGLVEVGVSSQALPSFVV